MITDTDRIASLSTSLLSALAEGKHMIALVDLCASALQNPVLVSTSYESRFFCSTKYSFTDPSALQSLDTPDVKDEYKKAFEAQNMKQKLSEASTPLIFEGNFEGGTRRIVGRVTHENRVIGYVIILESNKHFEAVDIALAQMTCEVISIKMQRQGKYIVEIESSNHYIRSLLSNKPLDYDTLTNWLRRIGWDSHSNFYTFSIETEMMNGLNFSVEPIRSRIENTVPNCETALNENVLVVLANPKNDQQLETIRKHMQECAEKFGIMIGMSPRFSSLYDLPRNSARASDALQAGRLLNGGASLCDYDELRLQSMLLKISKHMDLNEFFHEALNTLLDNDKLYGTNYYATLFAYIRAGGDKSRAAKKLFMHRNTFVYRLDKIAELIQLDLNDDDIRIFLYLSCNIKNLQDKLTSN